MRAEPGPAKPCRSVSTIRSIRSSSAGRRMSRALKCNGPTSSSRAGPDRIDLPDAGFSGGSQCEAHRLDLWQRLLLEAASYGPGRWASYS